MKVNGHEVVARPMRTDDIDRVHAVETACFAQPWSLESFQSEMNNLCARYVVLEEDGVIVAFGGMWLILDEAHINNIAVLPECRGRGYGRRVMKELMRIAYRALEITDMTLEVRVSNAVAIALYTSMGFEVAGRRKRYYEDNGEDAFVMWCHNTVQNLV